MRIFKKSVYFLFESGSLDSPGGPSSNRRYSITGVLRRRVIMNFTSKGPAEAKSTITLRRIHLIRRPYAKRRGRRETMFDCPLSKTVKILDQRSCSTVPFQKIQFGTDRAAGVLFYLTPGGSSKSNERRSKRTEKKGKRG